MTNPLQPWRRPGALIRAAAFVALGLPLALTGFIWTITFGVISAGLAVTFVLALPMVWVFFVTARLFARIDRARVRNLMGVHIPDPVQPLTKPRWLGRLFERFRSKARWKEVAHNVALLPVAAIGIVASWAAWCGSLAMLVLPLYVDSLPGGTAKFYFFELSSGPEALAATGVGLFGLLLVAPWVLLGAAWLQTAVAKALLGAGNAELVEQVQRLETRSAAAVGSAEAERRRIERDLHDGAQQRLVALAADLGAARERLDRDPEGAKEMVASAHEEAKQALREIRDLVRGIHPVILEDRGLDAALSAVVARSPVPVALDVDVAQRPPAAVESAAYFIVNEALTNVARHSQATRANVSVVRAGERLVIEVRDNGIGGADPDSGTGLRGLRDRAVSLGGTMHVISAPGGPTTVSVELPCGS